MPEIDQVVVHKTRFDILIEEIKLLHSMENWGTTLFLSTIALITKQIVDWGTQSVPIVKACPAGPWTVFLAPAILGLMAFLFLRVVNHRIRSVRTKLYALAEDLDEKIRGPGYVGLLMAGMPLATGLSASYFLYVTFACDLTSLQVTIFVSVVAVILAVCLSFSWPRHK